MKNDVYIIKTDILKYNNELYFNPSDEFPEGLNISIKSDKEVYIKLRELLKSMGLDKKNINKKEWNPFGEFIKQNNCVLIKPNLVKHINSAIDGTTDSLITNFSVIRPVIDYCIIALKGTGRIIVGDAPVQECDFNKVIKLNNLKEGIDDYNKNGYEVELLDFRKNNNDLECTIVALNNESELCETDEYCKKYAITNYDLKYMHQHHSKGKHEYLIPQVVLDSDVIINLPKPKTHRKAGITACMKNFIGINSKKEYLPHHRNGSIAHNGDEFPEKNIVKSISSALKNYSYLHNKIIDFCRKITNLFLKITKKNRFSEGSWYGNDTIWRTILDINKIILYADKNGKLQKKQQRNIFNIADMIVSGEKEGPLLPSDKKVGMIISGFNQLNMDQVICKIMGFDSKKIKYIKNGYNLKKYVISDKNYKIYDLNGVANIEKYINKFTPTDGWRDYLE